MKEFEGVTFCAQHVGPLGAHCTIVYDKESDSLAIFDPAGDAPILLETLRKLRGKKSGPFAHAMIILTHARLLPIPLRCVLRYVFQSLVGVVAEQILITRKAFRT